jgi:microcystin-dependent protein
MNMIYLKKILVICTAVLSVTCGSKLAFAGDNPFIGEVRFVGFNFAPRGWAKCDGQLLAISSNQALFSILGTIYGGNGRTTFALPDMRGRTPVHEGNGPGLTPYRLGQKTGTEQIFLNTTQLPSHSHTANASRQSARTTDATNGALARTRSNLKIYDNSAPNETLKNTTLGNTGNGQGMNNMQPYNTMNCIIALTGIFPSRS